MSTSQFDDDHAIGRMNNSGVAEDVVHDNAGADIGTVDVYIDRHSDVPSADVFAERRRAYMEAIGDKAVAVVHSLPESVRNGDVTHPYRQASDLYYLTGFAEPKATLVLRPGVESERVVLFVRPRNAERETWDGRRAGVDGAKNRYGADAAYPITELDKRLGALIANAHELYYSLGINPVFDRRIASAIAQLRKMERKGVQRPPRAIVDPQIVLHELRLFKRPEELALLRRAAEISCSAHVAAMKVARPGMYEYEFEALIHYIFRKNGGAGPGYGTIVGSGDNATILHYTDNNREARDGDLVLIDAGCE